jgi:hypothetical protein
MYCCFSDKWGLACSANSVSQSIPQSINGLRVIFIQTPANTPYLNAGERIITLLDNSASSMESANKFSNVESIKSLLNPGDLIEVWGGEGASEAQYDANHAATIESWEKNGSIQLYKPTTTIVNQGTAVSSDIGHTGVAAIQDTDTGIKTVIAISAHMVGITAGTSQNGAGSAFLVNATTNAGWFYQAGQFYYHDGTWANVYSYTSDNPANQARPFTLQYAVGHDYNYDVTYLGSDSVWWLGAADETTGYYNFFIDYNGHGSQLANVAGTGVWFENYNTNTHWNDGFPVFIRAYSARELITNPTYQWVNWTGDYPQLWIGGFGPYPASGVIYGHLAGNQTASWLLASVPLYQ